MASVFVSGGKLDTVRNIVTVGSAEDKPGMHIAALPCPKVNDEGLTGGWKILDGLAKSAALLASTRALQAARQQDKIARTYYKLAEQQWNFYKENYVPLEQQEIDEVHKEKPYKADYATAIKGHDCTEPVFASTEDHRDKIFDEYCVCPDPSMDIRYSIAMSTVKGDTHNFARRYAEALAERKDDIRWNKKLQVATRGRSLLPESSDIANKASSLFGQYSNAMSGLAGDAMGFSGYIRNRHETQFNAQRDNGIYRLNDPRYMGYTGHDPYGTSRIQAPNVPDSGYHEQFYSGGGRTLVTRADHGQSIISQLGGGTHNDNGFYAAPTNSGTIPVVYGSETY